MLPTNTIGNCIRFCSGCCCSLALLRCISETEEYFVANALLFVFMLTVEALEERFVVAIVISSVSFCVCVSLAKPLASSSCESHFLLEHENVVQNLDK